jgi:hypothetical protein
MGEALWTCISRIFFTTFKFETRAWDPSSVVYPLLFSLPDFLLIRTKNSAKRKWTQQYHGEHNTRSLSSGSHSTHRWYYVRVPCRRRLNGTTKSCDSDAWNEFFGRLWYFGRTRRSARHDDYGDDDNDNYSTPLWIVLCYILLRRAWLNDRIGFKWLRATGCNRLDQSPTTDRSARNDKLWITEKMSTYGWHFDRENYRPEATHIILYVSKWWKIARPGGGQMHVRCVPCRT